MRGVWQGVGLVWLVVAGLGSATAYAGEGGVASTEAPESLQPEASIEGIHAYRLPNGLQVLLAPDASKQTTTVNVTYKVGSRHEHYGETGMAHLLEHLLFKGTPGLPGKTIVQEFARRGMQFNGSTFFDRTNYHETFAASEDNLDWALRMEADRMVNSFIARADLDSEMSVVRNEMESGENDPGGILWQQMMATAYQWHNYGKSTIGARSDVENVKIENLQAFYRTYYQPDNAVLVVAGNFDETRALARITEYFGVIPRPARVLPPTYTRDPVQDGAREVSVSRVGDSRLQGAMYHIPAGAHPDMAALQLLAYVLGDSPSGRLHRALVEKKLAASADVEVLSLQEPGMLMAFLQLDKTQSPQAARRALLAELEGLRQRPVTEVELKRARQAFKNAYEQALDDPAHFGVALSESIALGDWRLFFLERDRIEAATLAEVQRVAEHYLLAANRTLGEFIPTAKPQRAVIPESPALDTMLADYRGRAALAAGEAFDASPLNIEQRTQRSVLANGMQLALLAKRTRGNTVQGSLILRLGDAQTLRGKKHAAALTAAMLLRGAQGLTRQQIADRLDALKAQLDISGQDGIVTVAFETRRDQLSEFLDLLRTILREPSFPAAEFDQLRSQWLTALEAERSQPESLAGRALARHDNPYPKGDVRYAESLDEQLAAIKALRFAELQAFHRAFYGAAHAQLALIGDFDAPAVTGQVKRLFGDWRARQAVARIPTPFRAHTGEQIRLAAPDKANAFFVARLRLPLRDDSPDAAALAIANRVLGGGSLKSRLADRLRHQEGLSYDVGAFLQLNAYETNSLLGLYAIYAPGNLERLQRGLNEELARFVRDGITEQELQDARSGLLEAARIARTQDGALARTLASQLYQQRDMHFTLAQEARLQGLSVEDVNAAIRRHLNPAHFVQVFAGDFTPPAP